MTESRPDPDHLLEQVQREEEEKRRGKLKVFFGASAGVGKTYAMLQAAREAHRNGTGVLVGIVETHGRKETAALLHGLEILPAREMEYEGKTLKEFDLDEALRRRPELILIDELAHSNAPGSRHPKRWQDVEELLQAGIHVYTTLNVQHLESLNDVVGGITGIRVRETIPDAVFDKADDVVLVDLPPDELLRRLKEGKVYQPQQAERALGNFFNKGNLIALRELSLRRTADRVDADVKVFRASQSINRVWVTRETLLVGVSGEDGESAVRSAARLADRLESPWHAVHVETPGQPDFRRGRISQAMKLAQELGAQVAVVPGRNVAETLVEYARSRNITRILVGRKMELEGEVSWKHTLPPFLRASISRRIARLAPELDITRIAVSSQRQEEGGNSGVKKRTPVSTPIRIINYLWAALGCAGVIVLASWLRTWFDLANIAMLFLFVVLLTALRLGRGPAVFSAFLGVAAFDFFFVPPRFTLAVTDVQYLLTFAVMLAVALVTGHLTTGLRYQARAAARREARFRALYEMARDLSGALVREQIAATCDRFMRSGFHVKPTILLTDSKQRIVLPVESDKSLDGGVAQWAFDHGKPAGLGTDTLPGSAGLYFPLKAPMRTRGVLAVIPEEKKLLEPEQIRQIETAASLIAIALERVHYVEVAQDALVNMESERLRNSLLAALSHDVRTPLTALVGLADTLSHSPDALTSRQLELVSALSEEARRMNRLVNNLLDMARLTAGKIQLHLEWQSMEEVVGSAIRSLEIPLRQHPVRTSIPRETPLVRFDAVLIERVLCNLLENAVKYTPVNSEIRLSAAKQGENLEVRVEDDGPGISSGLESRIFEKFTRGDEESSVPGMGLGLSICRAIVEAHRGKIRAERSHTGGAAFIFTLPLGSPPEMIPEK